MLVVATNWNTISALATGVGTLVLAVATFASVRSANRSARIAEEALLEQRQPVFSSSRFDDPAQKVFFVDQHRLVAEGGRGAAEYANGNVYLAFSLRNVGAGIGVCQSWSVCTGLQSAARAPQPRSESAFRAQTRDLFIPPGDIGIWQGAIREVDDPDYASLVEAVQTRQAISIELLYSDQIGGQRTITRFALIPAGDDIWLASSSRHWFLERPGPRSDQEVLARAEVISRSVEAAAAEAAAEAAAAEGAQQSNGSQADGAQIDGAQAAGGQADGSQTDAAEAAPAAQPRGESADVAPERVSE